MRAGLLVRSKVYHTAADRVMVVGGELHPLRKAGALRMVLMLPPRIVIITPCPRPGPALSQGCHQLLDVRAKLIPRAQGLPEKQQAAHCVPHAPHAMSGNPDTRVRTKDVGNETAQCLQNACTHPCADTCTSSHKGSDAIVTAGALSADEMCDVGQGAAPQPGSARTSLPRPHHDCKILVLHRC